VLSKAPVYETAYGRFAVVQASGRGIIESRAERASVGEWIIYRKAGK